MLVDQPTCTVDLECCGGAHFLYRALGAMSPDVKLIPPRHVKPFVTR